MALNKLINALFHRGNPAAIEQGGEEERKVRKDTKLVDLAHEAMVERAASDRADLEGLVRKGWPHVRREKFRSKVRSKVWGVVSENWNEANNDMVDEITDRIVDVAEVDDYYKKMFDKGNL